MNGTPICSALWTHVAPYRKRMYGGRWYLLHPVKRFGVWCHLLELVDLIDFPDTAHGVTITGPLTPGDTQ